MTPDYNDLRPLAYSRLVVVDEYDSAGKSATAGLGPAEF
jgi:hypothetical protein